MYRRDFLNGLGVASAGLLADPGILEATTTAGRVATPPPPERTEGRASIERIEDEARRLVGQSAREVARDEDFWREVQQSFSVSRSVVNLNNAGLCACTKIVTDAVLDLTMEQEKLPPYTAFTTLPPRLDVVRVKLAKLLGCHPEEVDRKSVV